MISAVKTIFHGGLNRPSPILSERRFLSPWSRSHESDFHPERAVVPIPVGFPDPAMGPAGNGDITDIIQPYNITLAGRIDWPTPASPTWQVYEGDFGLASSRASLTPVDNNLMSLAVREGTYAANYDIEAQLAGHLSGVAFRVQDKDNYYCLRQAVTNQGGQNLYVALLYQAIDGQWSWTGVMSFITTVQSNSTPRHMRLKVDGGNLGVWVQENGSWQMLVDPTQDGAGVLTTTVGGLVGLAADKTDAAVCTLLRVGSDGDSDLALDPTGEAWVNETFATSLTPSYDAVGNLTGDGVYTYTFSSIPRFDWPIGASYRASYCRVKCACGGGSLQASSELAMLLDGIDLKSLPRVPRYRRTLLVQFRGLAGLSGHHIGRRIVV
jgi:hypothetical protein